MADEGQQETSHGHREPKAIQTSEARLPIDLPSADHPIALQSRGAGWAPSLLQGCRAARLRQSAETTTPVGLVGLVSHARPSMKEKGHGTVVLKSWAVRVVRSTSERLSFPLSLHFATPHLSHRPRSIPASYPRYRRKISTSLTMVSNQSHVAYTAHTAHHGPQRTKTKTERPHHHPEKLPSSRARRCHSECRIHAVSLACLPSNNGLVTRPEQRNPSVRQRCQDPYRQFDPYHPGPTVATPTGPAAGYHCKLAAPRRAVWQCLG